MNVLDTLRIAWQGASANKLRSALTVLGVLIGVSAVIILLAVGTGSSQAVQNRINQLGTNTITVLSRGRFGRGPSTDGHAVPERGADDAVGDRRSRTRTRRPTSSRSRRSSRRPRPPTYQARELLDLGDRDDPGLPRPPRTTRSRPAARSRPPTSPTAAASCSSARPCSATCSRPAQNPLGQTIQIGSASFQIIGVLAEKGTSGTTNQDSVVIAPYTAVQDELTGESTVVQRAARPGEVDRAA